VFRKFQINEYPGQCGPAGEEPARCITREDQDRRQGSRRRVLKSALIVFNKGYCTLGCHILDVSDTGAMVRPSDIFLCPGEFVLQPQVGPARECEVVWRRGDKMGVRFL
jgi:hypothetical protein